MAFAGRSEIAKLSRLLRGLSLQNYCCNGVKSRQFNVAASCVQQKNKSLFHHGSDGRSPTNFVQQQHILTLTVSSILCSRSDGIYLQQQRTYARAAPQQKKKLSFDYSGDLATQRPLNPQATHVDFKDFTQLGSASEPVQKLCSIDFASGTEKKTHRREEMKDRIFHLFGPDAIKELHVANLTVDIRNMIPHVLACRKDKLSKARLVEKIQLRKKMLKNLRRNDYQRFLWLLQELRIRYVLPPDYHKRITRKYRRKQQVWEAANSLRQKKIDDLKAQLEAEKAEFLKYKEDVLKQIEEDAQRYELDLTDFEKKLQRQRVGKTYPRIYTWEERQKLPEGHPLKPEEKKVAEDQSKKKKKKKK